jgi:hypothetical protein
MTEELYRHICGYPLREDSKMTRCPGCGGRITPWNTNLADETMAESFGSADAALQHLADWLKKHHPTIAQELRDALQRDLSKGDVASQEALLQQLQSHLGEDNR